MVKLFGDALEGGPEVRGGRQLEVTAAGGCGDQRQPGIGLVVLPARPATPAATTAAAAVSAPSAAAGKSATPSPSACAAHDAILAGEPDRVHHHVFLLRAPHDLFERAVVRAVHERT